MNRRWVLKLTANERAWPEVRTAKSAEWNIQHAHTLLKMDKARMGRIGTMSALPKRLA